MYDTVRLIAECIKPERRKQVDGWNLKADEATGNVESNTASIYLNKIEGTGSYNGTVNIQYLPERSQVIIGCSSLPAMLYGTSLRQLSQADIGKAQDNLQVIIDPYVDIDIGKDCYLSRLDNSTVYNVSEPVPHYIDFLNQITAQKRYHSTKSVYKQETIQFRSNNWNIGFYDKVVNERSKRGDHIGDMSTEGNLLRFESQFQNTQSIRDKWKLPSGYRLTFPELKDERIAKRTLDQRAELFSKYFPYSEKAVLANYRKEFQMIDGMYAKNTKTESLLMYALLQDGHTPEEIIQMFKYTTMSRATISRKKQLINEVQAIRSDGSSLYEEIRDLIAGEAA